MNDDDISPVNRTDDIDLEKLLQEKEKLESLIKKKFTKVVTVMFTDLSGSTRMSEELGDLTMRALLKRHYDIVIPIIEMNAGVLVKTMGDGTMSYFEEPTDALRASIKIQEEIAKFNQESHQPPLLIRCGLNTGVGIVEKKDVNGDVVNVAQRFESLAAPQEILISEDTYTPAKEDEGLSITFLRETEIKGKSGPQKVYKVLWMAAEIERFQKSGASLGGEEEYEGAGAATADFSLDKLKEKLAIRLTVKRKGAQPVTYEISTAPKILGRSTKADIVVPEQYISRQHAKVYKEGATFYIEDLKSHVGIQFKGDNITRRQIENGDTYTIGSVVLSFEFQSQDVKKDEQFYDETSDTIHIDAGAIYQLVLKEQNRDIAKYELSGKPMIIGRQEGCDIRLQSPMVSRKHAQVFIKEGKVLIEDFGSNNGTYVEGKKITKELLTEGQKITIGPFAIEVQNPLQKLNPISQEIGDPSRKP